MHSTTSNPPDPVAPATPFRTSAFAFLLLLSGFCGISYEVLYARILSNAIGDQFAVSASILVTFLLGMGCGTLFAHRLWRYLWLVEGAIGLSGVLFALGSETLESWYYGTASWGGGLGGAMAFCFVLLIVPAFLIGCSLPLFAGYLGRFTSRAAFARAYMIYNFGAASTVVAIEFGLFRLLGLRDTVLTMAALNGIVSLALLLGFGGVRSRPEPRPPPLEVPRRAWLALALASVASAVFQLLMLKVAECFLGPFRETFALVLAVVLFGIAAGSALLKRVRVDLAWLLVLALVGLAFLLAGFSWVTRGYAFFRPLAVGHALSNVLLRVAALLLLMGLPVLAFGATVPALLRRLGTEAHDSGRLLFVSSLGNALGFLLMAFALHRYLDYGAIVVVIGALTAAALVLATRGRGRAVVAGLVLFGALLGLARFRWDEELLYLSYDAYLSLDDLEWYRSTLVSTERFKGKQDTFALNRMGDKVYFFINGYVSINLESAPERLVGAFPALFAPRTDRALVLGVGSGITTGTLAMLFDHVDAVEINPVVLQNLHRMSAYNFDLVSRPNARLVVDDGIHFTRVTPESYSLIISTVTSPRYFSSGKLYTQDFFETIRRRLTPDGLYVTWVDMLVGQTGLDIMLKTATQSFRHCSLATLNTGYFLLLCSDEPLVLRRPRMAADNEALSSYLTRNGLRPEWLPYGLLTTRAAEAIRDPSVPIHTRDYPALEFQAARLADRDTHDFAESLLERKMNMDDVASVLRPAMEFDPMHLVLYAQELLGDSEIADGWIHLAGKETDDFPAKHRAARLEDRAWAASVSDSAEAHELYAADLLDADRLDDAIAQGKQALVRDPEVAGAHRIVGLAHERKGEFRQALDRFGRAVDLDPADTESGVAMGRIHFGLREYERAVECLERAQASAVEAPGSELYRTLGMALEALGRKEEADRAYGRARQAAREEDSVSSPPRP